VKDRTAAIQFGKALFWDAQVGGKGEVACATCHHQAGSDARVANRVNPRDTAWESVGGPGATLTPALFPITSNDVVGSGGVELQAFIDVQLGSAEDLCEGTPLAPFHGFRQVTDRDAQPSINAIFNERQFWDGRASDVFNGVDPSGKTRRRVVTVNRKGTRTVRLTRKHRLDNSSAASQAVGPPNSEVEMSCAGRSFAKLGAKMLSLSRPLDGQRVAGDDSVLGDLARPGGGLDTDYTTMIRDAFKSKWWNSSAVITFGADGDPIVGAEGTPTSTDEFTVMEANFSLFWGLAIQLYESTLVSDETPFDRGELSASARHGLEVFEGNGRCDQCHDGSLFTEAVVNGGSDGFTNTAVRPVREDSGRGDGEFKTSGLRNIALTNPYFHNGGYLTLRQVVDFYDRGGDFPNDKTDSQVRELELSEREKVHLVQFMLELTDDRVRCEQAPFDHPSLQLPDGPLLHAVGARGAPEASCLVPVLSDGNPNFHFER
jgi:cytochrome c peroxidase